MKLLYQSIIIGSVLGLASCSTVSYSTHFSQSSFQVKDVLSKQVEVVYGNEMYRTGYEKPFEKRFTDNEGYFKFLQDEFIKKLKNYNPSVQKGSGEGMDAMTGLVSLKEEDVQSARNFFKNSEADLILFIKGARIRQEIQNNYMAPTGQPGMPMNNSSKESCVVTVIVSVWDVQSQRKVHEFSTTDQTNVVLFTYQANLEGASIKAIESALAYMEKNGKTK